MENVVRTIQAILLFGAVFMMLSACSEQVGEAKPFEEALVVPAAVPVASGDLSIVSGQRLYVPAYSEVYSANQELTLNMTVTLSIRNTNADKPIFISSVQYFDTDGQLVTEYVETTLRLAPMATTEYVIAQRDDRGGTGANFIVSWGAGEPVYEPVVETVMISISGTQGLALLSPARVLEEEK